MKCRVKPIQTQYKPRVHEVIQLVVYMHVTQSDAGDLAE
jgi:hypothetical protein